MSWTITLLSQKQAEEIAYSWKYEGSYSFYDMTSDQEDLTHFLDPAARGTHVHAVMYEAELVGFIEVTPKDRIAEVGMGLKPSWTGRGIGLQFMEKMIDFLRSHYHVERITLAVAAFNKRAITVYERAGFSKTGVSQQQTNDSIYEFIHMSLSINID
ncbi:GNAT family N-acetyltransferase [Bacillus daqingensis]|uniref:GNAT family N-acetyltransferase n=1 Tax=Bacillus daqingensis TaxID=872396 RepID=A0ABV9NUU0_9BACI